MTEIERIEADIQKVERVIKFLSDRLTFYREREGSLVMDLNRARRLEREEKELQGDAD